MTARPWTGDERATLRRMAGQGYTDGEIARHLGRSRWAVWQHRTAMGLNRGCPQYLVNAAIRGHKMRLTFADNRRAA